MVKHIDYLNCVGRAARAAMTMVMPPYTAWEAVMNCQNSKCQYYDKRCEEYCSAPDWYSISEGCNPWPCENAKCSKNYLHQCIGVEYPCEEKK